MFDYIPGDLWVEVVYLKHDTQTHFLDSVTAEIQVPLYAKLAPDSADVMSHKNFLLHRAKRYKARASALGEKMRALEWRFRGGRICQGATVVEEEVVVNPYQNYFAEGPDAESGEDRKENEA